MGSMPRSLRFCGRVLKNTLQQGNDVPSRSMSTFVSSSNQSNLLKMCSTKSTLQSHLERSIWYLAPSISKNFKSTDSWSNTGVSCMCGSFHSKSDAAFSKVLVDEIKDERLRMANVPEPSDGWTLKQDGTSCTLSKLAENNQIEVSFNVNGSIPPAASENTEDEIIAQPDFVVDIRKPSSSITLSFECYYPEELSDEEDGHAVFSIRSVMAYEGNINETKYVIDTDNIDPKVYEHMVTFLQNRGITNLFAEELIAIATTVENTEYINTLERLETFVSCT